MSATENRELIRTIFSELARGNAAAFLGALSDDVKYNLIGTGKFSGTFNGKQELIAKLLAPLTAALENGIAIRPDNLIADGEYVAMQSAAKRSPKTAAPTTTPTATSSASPTESFPK